MSVDRVEQIAESMNTSAVLFSHLLEAFLMHVETHKTCADCQALYLRTFAAVQGDIRRKKDLAESMQNAQKGGLSDAEAVELVAKHRREKAK